MRLVSQARPSPILASAEGARKRASSGIQRSRVSFRDTGYLYMRMRPHAMYVYLLQGYGIPIYAYASACYVCVRIRDTYICVCVLYMRMRSHAMYVYLLQGYGRRIYAYASACYVCVSSSGIRETYICVCVRMLCMCIFFRDTGDLYMRMRPHAMYVSACYT
jgi:hypothetical protein